jgi:hypothetical protein
VTLFLEQPNKRPEMFWGSFAQFSQRISLVERHVVGVSVNVTFNCFLGKKDGKTKLLSFRMNSYKTQESRSARDKCSRNNVFRRKSTFYISAIKARKQIAGGCSVVIHFGGVKFAQFSTPF